MNKTSVLGWLNENPANLAQAESVVAADPAFDDASGAAMVAAIQKASASETQYDADLHAAINMAVQAGSSGD